MSLDDIARKRWTNELISFQIARAPAPQLFCFPFSAAATVRLTSLTATGSVTDTMTAVIHALTTFWFIYLVSVQPEHGVPGPARWYKGLVTLAAYHVEE
jgi:hypothetical protein